jgi:CRP/FNR family transcriptional regulator, cyclic AMP receptor protein
MIQENPQIDRFKRQLRDSLQRETEHSRGVTIAKNAHVYTCGDPGETVYFIESGQIKLLMLSPQGKECLLAIHTAGDIFGESCLSGLSARVKTAIAREETVLKQFPRPKFFARLSRDGLFEGFVQYLAVRIADQQQVIANLVTVDSEQRLGKTLLQLARKLGKQDPRGIRIGKDTCIEHKISHEELSEMVGTTRPRISVFMQRFRNLGLVETSAEHFLIIKENKLTAYLAQLCETREHSFQNRPVLSSNASRVSVTLNTNRSRMGALARSA